MTGPLWTLLGWLANSASPDDGREAVVIYHAIEREALAVEGPDPTDDDAEPEDDADYSDWEPEESDDDDDAEPEETDISEGDEDWAGRVSGGAGDSWGAGPWGSGLGGY